MAIARNLTGVYGINPKTSALPSDLRYGVRDGISYGILTKDFDAEDLIAVAIDLKTGTSTNILTIATGYNFIPLGCIIYGNNVNTVGVQPTISLGVSAGSYTDILGNTDLNFTNTSAGLNDYMYISLSGGRILAAESEIFLNRSVLATGTSYTINVFLRGKYI